MPDLQSMISCTWLVEIREDRVYRICNFDVAKRSTLPQLGYWLSIVPIWPLLKRAVSSFCCSILPDLFSDNQDNIFGSPDDDNDQPGPATNVIKAKTARQGVRSYQRTDIRATARNQFQSLRFFGELAGDTTLDRIVNPQARTGVRKQTLMKSSVNDASAELSRHNIEVTSVRDYDPKDAVGRAADFIRTPERIRPGSKVTLYQQNGRVVFYAVEREAAATIEISEDVKAEFAQYETRKANLANFTEVNAELARVETRLAGVSELDGLKEELSVLQAEKAAAQEELAALRSQIESVQAERAAEEQHLAQLDTQRATLTTSLTELNRDFTELAERQQELQLETERIRPVTDLPEVDARINTELSNFGIRTLEELSRATPETIIRRGGINTATANRIINAAKNRLER